MVNEGFIEIEPSNGSDSSSDTSDEEPGARSREPESFREQVPFGQIYVRNSKSELVHCAKTSGELTKCEIKITGHFKTLDRITNVKMPKCLNCVPKYSRILTGFSKLDDLVSRMDSAVERVRDKNRDLSSPRGTQKI